MNQALITTYVLVMGNPQVKYCMGDPDHGNEPDSVHDYLGSENANGEPSTCMDERLKRCYELAGWTLMMNPRLPNGSTMIHGSWHGPNAPERIGHAWLKIPGGDNNLKQNMVWEPIRGLFFLEPEFYEWTRAWDEREYTRRVTARMIFDHDDFGRWHESRYP